MSDVSGPGADSQYGEISTHPQTGDRVPGIPGKLTLLTLGFPTQKDEEDLTRGSNPHTVAAGVDKRPGQIC